MFATPLVAVVGSCPELFMRTHTALVVLPPVPLTFATVTLKGMIPPFEDTSSSIAQSGAVAGAGIVVVAAPVV